MFPNGRNFSSRLKFHKIVTIIPRVFSMKYHFMNMEIMYEDCFATKRAIQSFIAENIVQAGVEMNFLLFIFTYFATFDDSYFTQKMLQS